MFNLAPSAPSTSAALAPASGDPAQAASPDIAISNSRLATISTCPRKYQLANRFLHPANQRSSGLAAVSGTAIHAYIQSRLAGHSDEQATLAFFLSWDFTAEDAEFDKAYQSDAARHRNLTASYASAVSVWEQVSHEQNNLIHIIPIGATEPIPAIEIRVEIILTAPSLNLARAYTYEGTLDFGLRVDLDPDAIRLIDIKTHREYKSENLEARYRYATQLIPYGIAIETCTGRPISKITTEYWAIRTDQLAPEFTKFHYNRSASDIINFLRELRRQIAVIEGYASNETWPRTTHGCTAYQERCRFFNVCHIEPHAQLQALILGFNTPEPKVDFNPHIKLTINLDDYI